MLMALRGILVSLLGVYYFTFFKDYNNVKKSNKTRVKCFARVWNGPWSHAGGGLYSHLSKATVTQLKTRKRKDQHECEEKTSDRCCPGRGN